MKLIFAGSGSAFTQGSDNWQSNMVLQTEEGKNLLIDCGSDARHSLAEIGLGHQDIDQVYISHLHADHVGGMEWLGFYRYFDPDCKRPRLYISGSLADEIWSSTLRGGMSSVQGKVVKLDDYFDVMPIEKNGTFDWEGVRFQLVQTIRFLNGFTIVPSFGLMFEINGIKVFLTTDTQFCPNQIQDFYNMADVIFHDCETAEYESGVHAHFNELIGLPTETKGKMWFYHYQSGELPDALSHGFRGFVRRGQVFDFNDPRTLEPA